MSDIVLDSSVLAKWLLPEADSEQAHRLVSDAATHGDRLIVLDLVFVEVANAVWKRVHQRLMSLVEARRLLELLLRSPVEVEPATRLLGPSLEIAAKYDRAVYDALFVALAQDLGLMGVSADEPLVSAVRTDYPQIILLRDWLARPSVT